MSKRIRRSLLKSFLYSVLWFFGHNISPRFSHTLAYWGLRDGAFPPVRQQPPELNIDVFGQHFSTPIGIGAGVDKRGNIIDSLIYMGFGFGEFGPYTLEREMPIKETYYLTKERAVLVQCLGYRNPGLQAMLPIFINRRYLPNVIGINLTITTHNEGENIKMGRLMSYMEEFPMMVQKVAPYCDYITVDFGHPESELSALVSDASTMLPLLKAIKEAAQKAAPIQTPSILVKLPLDLTPLEIPLVCQILSEAEIAGIIVAGPTSLFKNTGISIQDKKVPHVGMLSGAPTQKYLVELIGKVYQFTRGKIPIIGCDGVFSGQDAFDQIKAGASLVQVNTALTYEGPQIITKINRELVDLLRQNGYASVKEAIGADFY